MIFSSTVTIEGCRVTSLANLRGIGINGASPVLDGYVLRSNKQYGLAYNESSKPQLAGLKPMRVTKLEKSTVTTNSNSNSTTSAEGLKARSINTEKV